MSARTDPYLDFRFHVEIDAVIVGGFTEVTGLEVELETEEYEEGGVNTHTHTLPKRAGYPNLTLRRGLTDATTLWEWLEATVAGRIERKNVRILLLDPAGAETWGWECHDAYPVRWAGPELQADQATVAIESLELAHTGLTTMEGLPRG